MRSYETVIKAFFVVRRNAFLQVAQAFPKLPERRRLVRHPAAVVRVVEPDVKLLDLFFVFDDRSDAVIRK